MAGSNGKDPGTAGGTQTVIDQDAMDKGLNEFNGLTKEAFGQKNGKRRMEYLKEATVVMDIMNNKGIKAEDIIRSVTRNIGHGKLLAVRPKNSTEYELTLTCADDCDDLINGVEIKGQLCVVRRLELKECVVSFIHLPAYVEDETIEDKLKLWGVTPITKIKRRLYPGTDITDGTRYVKIRFPKEITSLPYSAKFETSEGERYFRVIHDGQIKLCRMCMQPGHVFKDCPDFKCYECAEQGHFAKDCKAEKCLDCNNVLMKCECETENEYQHFEVTERGNEVSPQNEVEQNMRKEKDGLISKDCSKEPKQKNEAVEEADDGRKEEEEKSWCNENIVEMEEDDDTTTRDRGNRNKNNVNKRKRKNVSGNVLKHKAIPNLKLVLRKQKLRRDTLEKKKNN